MRDYSKISPAVWQSPRFNNLPSDDGRYLYLFLLTCQHQNSAGCYRLPDGYACNDLNWLIERYLNARKILIDAGLILFDGVSSVLMITRWFKHNPPMNEKHFIGIERTLERLDSETIYDAACAALNEAWESIEAEKAARLQRKQKLAHGLSNGLQGAMPDRLQTPYLIGKG